MKCIYSEICSGCDSIGLARAEQKIKQQVPVASLVENFEKKSGKRVKWIEIADCGLRDRVDLVYTGDVGPKLGLYDKDKKEIIDLKECPQMSAALADFYSQVRNIRFQVRKGSIRLRVSPQGLKGIWLDFANLDIKNLLEEKSTLEKLSVCADVIEIGQKRKRWNKNSGKLSEAHPETWFQTYLGERVLPLYCYIGSFTQPGFLANRALSKEVLEYVDKTKLQSICEFGSGVGNFTLPLLEKGYRVTALEFDSSAVDLLQMNIDKFLSPEAKVRAEIKQGNFHREGQIDFSQCEVLVADPPRSGLGDFLGSLRSQNEKNLKGVIYVSCFPESFLKDTELLIELGFKLSEISFVNQFPQTTHIEVVSLWLR
ncbi:MAG: hypothetical protein AB7O96_10600 [Pseudobdellovibrionaceae bacterium]